MPNPGSQDIETGDQAMSFSRRVRRSLARRFPRARKVYHFLLRAGRRVRNFPRQSVVTTRWLWRCRTEIRRRQREPRLTIGIDIGPFWEPLTGVGWYLYRLLEHLADRDDVRIRLYPPTIIESFLSPYPAPTVELPSGPALELVSYDLPGDLVIDDEPAVKWLREREANLVGRDRNQVLFAPNYFLPAHFNEVPGALVATIHDLGFRKVPWTLRDETLDGLAARLHETLTGAELLITVSHTVRDELVSYGYASTDQIRVVHHGAGLLKGVEAGELPSGVPPRFALHVGTLEPRKNISTLLACWRLLRERMSDAPTLVLSGRFGWKAEDLEAEVAAAEQEGWLRHLGYVPEEELARLYLEASIVVFPTLYEGFGLPSVEAMAAETPLVCSDIPVLHEVAGDAALYASPESPDELARQLQRVLTDERLSGELISLGRARLEAFDWERTAEETLAVWREAAAAGQSANDDNG
jgi:glycosyltransferase involved in cell wall biosynthesis